MPAITDQNIIIKYFTKEDLTRLHRQNVTNIQDSVVEELSSETCFPVYHSTTVDDKIIVTVALNQQGDTCKVTLTSEEFDGMPTKSIPRPY